MSTIRPGAVWRDTRGNRIQAHGGSILEVDGVFYWYGENKERTTPGGDIWHWGVRAYASTDLVSWEDQGVIIPPRPDDPSSPLHPHAQMDRPHILFNETTGKYVAWLKIMGIDDSDAPGQTETILIADDFLGPYEIVRTGYRPHGMEGGDFDLVKDPRTGKAYYLYDNIEGSIVATELSDDYTEAVDPFTVNFSRVGPFCREAPAFFERSGKLYLLTSGRTGYFPNPTEAAVTDDYLGPWTELGNIHRGDTELTSFGAQISSVFKHPGKKDLYIALGDRWVPNEQRDYPDIRPGIKRLFSAPDPQQALMEAMQAMQDGAAEERPATPGFREFDTANADYVWLPISFDGDRPYIEWRDEWSPDDFE